LLDMGRVGGDRWWMGGVRCVRCVARFSVFPPSRPTSLFDSSHYRFPSSLRLAVDDPTRSTGALIIAETREAADDAEADAGLAGRVATGRHVVVVAPSAWGVGGACDPDVVGLLPTGGADVVFLHAPLAASGRWTALPCALRAMGRRGRLALVLPWDQQEQRETAAAIDRLLRTSSSETEGDDEEDEEDGRRKTNGGARGRLSDLVVEEGESGIVVLARRSDLRDGAWSAGTSVGSAGGGMMALASWGDQGDLLLDEGGGEGAFSARGEEHRDCCMDSPRGTPTLLLLPLPASHPPVSRSPPFTAPPLPRLSSAPGVRGDTRWPSTNRSLGPACRRCLVQRGCPADVD